MVSGERGSSLAPLSLDEPALARVLDALRAARGLDFRQYRTTTIRRRLERRLAAVRAADVEGYLRLLSARPAEIDDLVDYLTLKVSAFFRDARTFDLLQRVVVPDLVEQACRKGRPGLIWSAGCATGEEVYSLAILLLGESDRRGATSTSLVVGTDIDPRALDAARAAVYPAAQLQGVTPEILQRWFEPTCPERDVWRPRERVRAVVSFRAHDLTAEREECPASLDGRPFDLVVCRNVLIYMQRPLQLAVLGRLDRYLGAGGYLVLGEAESLPEELRAAYDIVDRRARVFRKRSSNDLSSAPRVCWG